MLHKMNKSWVYMILSWLLWIEIGSPMWSILNIGDDNNYTDVALEQV